jgi:undecaprenyl diphosphate synthase
MLWQLAYTELFFLNKLWPDFNSNDLINVVKKFKNTKRNFGGI